MSGAIRMGHEQNVNIPATAAEIRELVGGDQVGAATDRLEISPVVVVKNAHHRLPLLGDRASGNLSRTGTLLVLRLSQERPDQAFGAMAAEPGMLAGLGRE